MVNSRRFGFMWHAPSDLAITGGTVVNSPHATFLNKGQQIGVTVDGSKGARLNPGDGILVQVIDNDAPGPVMVNGVLENARVYTQPAGEPARDATFDVSVAHATDSALSFADIELAGNFYNGMRGDLNLVLRSLPAGSPALSPPPSPSTTSARSRPPTGGSSARSATPRGRRSTTGRSSRSPTAAPGR